MALLRMLAIAVGALALGCATTRKRDVTELVQLEGDAIVVRETIQFEHGKAGNAQPRRRSPSPSR